MTNQEIIVMLEEDIARYEELAKEPALAGYVVRQVQNIAFHLRKLKHDISPTGAGFNTERSNQSRDPFEQSRFEHKGTRTGRFPRKS